MSSEVERLAREVAHAEVALQRLVAEKSDDEETIAAHDRQASEAYERIVALEPQWPLSLRPVLAAWCGARARATSPERPYRRAEHDEADETMEALAIHLAVPGAREMRLARETARRTAARQLRSWRADLRAAIAVWLASEGMASWSVARDHAIARSAVFLSLFALMLDEEDPAHAAARRARDAIRRLGESEHDQEQARASWSELTARLRALRTALDPSSSRRVA